MTPYRVAHDQKERTERAPVDIGEPTRPDRVLQQQQLDRDIGEAVRPVGD